MQLKRVDCMFYLTLLFKNYHIRLIIQSLSRQKIRFFFLIYQYISYDNNKKKKKPISQMCYHSSRNRIIETQQEKKTQRFELLRNRSCMR